MALIRKGRHRERKRKLMEVSANKVMNNKRSEKNEEDEEGTVLPGFRFHPTDEELVGFYLRRKVEKKPLRIQLIKHIDIYKYDPWDLPSNNPLPFLILYIYIYSSLSLSLSVCVCV